MSALGSQYIGINSTLLPETASFDIDREVIEKVFQSEAGTDITVVKRYGKRKYSLSWEGADDTFRAQVEGYCDSASVSVSFNGESFTARARNLKEKLVRYSNRYSGSAGLWDISFDLEEI